MNPFLYCPCVQLEDGSSMEELAVQLQLGIEQGFSLDTYLSFRAVSSLSTLKLQINQGLLPVISQIWNPQLQSHYFLLIMLYFPLLQLPHTGYFLWPVYLWESMNHPLEFSLQATSQV